MRGMLLSVALAMATTALGQHPVSIIHDRIERAQPGDSLSIAAGVYQGNLEIRKPISLEADGLVVIDGMGKGTVVDVLAEGVTVRGFTIRRSGDSVTGEDAGIRVLAGGAIIEGNTIEDALFGIDLRESPGSVVRGNTISGKDLEAGRRGDGIRLWWSHDTVVHGNVVSNSRDMVFWYSENLRIEQNRVTSSRYGLHFMYSHDTVLRENELEGNSVGIYLMYSNSIRLVGNRMRNNRGPSGYGIGLKDCDDIAIVGNALLANRVGVYIDNSPSAMDSTGLFEGNMIAFNEVGVLATPNTHDNVFTANAFVENEEPAATHGRGELHLNQWARDGVGNYWSQYAGFDLDGDGIGDMDYEPQSLFGQMLASEPNLRLFVHSPAQQAIEFTARALPELRPRPVLIDPAPLARPPAIEVVMSGAQGSGNWMALASLGMLVPSTLIVALLGRDRALAPASNGGGL
jgi:nitrous oxidase accessory protein